MVRRRHKQKNAEALSKRLRRKFYNGAAVATSVYVALSLVRFHGQFSYLPSALVLIWTVFLLCYTTLKEVFRWNDLSDEEIYHGEMWAGVVLAGWVWMMLWNFGRTWIFGLHSTPFPEDYQFAAMETILLYTLSTISAFLHKYKAVPEKPRHHRARNKAAHHDERPVSMAPSNILEAQPAKNPSTPEVILAKAPPRSEDASPEEEPQDPR